MHRPLRPGLTYANVMASVAVFIALGGTSVAAVALKNNSVRSKHIKNGQVQRSDLRNNAVNSARVGDRSLLARDFAAGQLPRGPKGDTGPRGRDGAPGAPGAPGSPGVTGMHQVFDADTPFNSTSPKTASVTCPAGEKVVAPWGLAEGATGPISGVSLTSITVDQDLRTVTVSASEDAAGVGTTTWFVRPGAICGRF